MTKKAKISIAAAVSAALLFGGSFIFFKDDIAQKKADSDISPYRPTPEIQHELDVISSDLMTEAISKQLLQWFVCTEISLDQILSVLSFGISLCDTVRSAAPVNKPCFTHSAIYRSEAYMSATLSKSCLNPPDTVILIVRML